MNCWLAKSGTQFRCKPGNLQTFPEPRLNSSLIFQLLSSCNSCMFHEGRCKALRSYLSTELQEEDTMENFMQQMLAIEQSRVDREATGLDKEASVCKNEKAQAAEWWELDCQEMADQQDRFMRLMEGVQGARARTPPPPPAL